MTQTEKPAQIFCLVDKNHKMSYRDESDGFAPGHYCNVCDYMELDGQDKDGIPWDEIMASQLRRQVR